jgi:hypothetical protein
MELPEWKRGTDLSRSHDLSTIPWTDRAVPRINWDVPQKVAREGCYTRFILIQARHAGYQVLGTLC